MVPASKMPNYYYYYYYYYCEFPHHHYQVVAQSAGAVYTLTISLQRGKTPPHTHNKRPGYDSKQHDGEVPLMLELWGKWSTPSLPSLPGPLWPRNGST